MRSGGSVATTLGEPFVEVFLDKDIILKMWVCSANSVNFFGLSGGKIFFRIETPTAFEQPLPPQDFVDPRDAAVEMVNRIKDGAIGIGQLLRNRYQI